MRVLQQRRPCAQRWLWPDCVKARNLLGSLHLLCFSLTHLSRGDWEIDREGEGGKTLVSPPPDSCGSVSPLPFTSSRPTLISHRSLFIYRDSCLASVFFISLSPSFSFSPTLRGGQEVEERRDGEKVTWLG